MSLEIRRTEKSIPFDLLRAQALNPSITEIKEINDVLFRLIATMEPEDVDIVEKQVAEYMKRLRS
ncbi:MAG: hypothetical protein FWE20_01900 [Defluviitaleaceae bacterium]|nr:hypothetical protein [Defluviitaleaceae bacterium]